MDTQSHGQAISELDRRLSPIEADWRWIKRLARKSKKNAKRIGLLIGLGYANAIAHMTPEQISQHIQWLAQKMASILTLIV